MSEAAEFKRMREALDRIRAMNLAGGGEEDWSDERWCEHYERQLGRVREIVFAAADDSGVAQKAARNQRLASGEE